MDIVYYDKAKTKIKSKTWRNDLGEKHRIGAPARIEFEESGEVMSEAWWVDGKRHRVNGPAYIVFYDKLKGVVAFKEWWVNGDRHRENGPAEIWYERSGNVRREEWWIKGKRHREDGPADILYDSDRVRRMSWWVDGKKHRDDGPAHIQYHSRSDVTKEWWVKGKKHREDGPAVQFYESDKVLRKEWWVDGKRHRVGAPAVIKFGHLGKVWLTTWWLFGVKYEKEFIDLISKMCRSRSWLNQCKRVRRSRELIEWFYGPNESGGRRDRQALRKFVMDI